MREERVRVLVEIALSIALAAVLGLVKITLPWNIAGGSVSLSMLPLLVLGLRRGVLPGVVAGVLYGVVDYFAEPWFVHPLQVLLDYPVAFGACGLSALARPLWRNGDRDSFAAPVRALTGSIIGGAARFVASFVSGMVFFGSNAAPGQAVWLYSLVYNASYVAPSAVACAAAAMLVVPALERAVPTARRAAVAP